MKFSATLAITMLAAFATAIPKSHKPSHTVDIEDANPMDQMWKRSTHTTHSHETHKPTHSVNLEDANPMEQLDKRLYGNCPNVINGVYPPCIDPRTGKVRPPATDCPKFVDQNSANCCKMCA